MDWRNGWIEIKFKGCLRSYEVCPGLWNSPFQPMTSECIGFPRVPKYPVFSATLRVLQVLTLFLQRFTRQGDVLFDLLTLERNAEFHSIYFNREGRKWSAEPTSNTQRLAQKRLIWFCHKNQVSAALGPNPGLSLLEEERNEFRCSLAVH